MQEIVRKCDWRRTPKARACGNSVTEATTFEWRGTTYDMDVCQQHLEEATDVMAPIFRIAQAQTSRVGKAVRKAMIHSNGRPFTTKDVRMWLREQGEDVPAAGRLPREQIEEYVAAHS